MQITTTDERWYAKPCTNDETGLPCYEYHPSVTWITSFYPKGPGFNRWLANSGGWDEAEVIKRAAGSKGSTVHQAIARLLDGETIQMGDVFLSPDREPAELTAEEYECLLAFADWWQSLTAPSVVAKDFVVWGDGYAGTVDLLAVMNGETWLIDFKTSQDVWPEHEIQVTAYRDALPRSIPHEVIKLAILQVGYRKNRRGWKFTEVAPAPALFAATRAIWAKETAGQRPIRKDYPLSVNLATTVSALDCPKCQGTGERACRQCRGTGRTPKGTQPCGGECQGLMGGTVPCLHGRVTRDAA